MPKHKSSAKARPRSSSTKQSPSQLLVRALESGMSPESFERHGNWGTYRVDLFNKLWEVKYSPHHGLPYVILAFYKTFAGAGRKVDALINSEMSYKNRVEHWEAIRPRRRSK